jgi:hypothetical protein
MTDELDAKRKAKAPRCEACGGAVHDYAGQCPRLAKITHEPDGGKTYWLYPIDDEPVAG